MPDAALRQGIGGGSANSFNLAHMGGWEEDPGADLDEEEMLKVAAASAEVLINHGTRAEAVDAAERKVAEIHESKVPVTKH